MPYTDAEILSAERIIRSDFQETFHEELSTWIRHIIQKDGTTIIEEFIREDDSSELEYNAQQKINIFLIAQSKLVIPFILSERLENYLREYIAFEERGASTELSELYPDPDFLERIKPVYKKIFIESIKKHYIRFIADRDSSPDSTESTMSTPPTSPIYTSNKFGSDTTPPRANIAKMRSPIRNKDHTLRKQILAFRSTLLEKNNYYLENEEIEFLASIPSDTRDFLMKNMLNTYISYDSFKIIIDNKDFIKNLGTQIYLDFIAYVQESTNDLSKVGTTWNNLLNMPPMSDKAIEQLKQDKHILRLLQETKDSEYTRNIFQLYQELIDSEKNCTLATSSEIVKRLDELEFIKREWTSIKEYIDTISTDKDQRMVQSIFTIEEAFGNIDTLKDKYSNLIHILEQYNRCLMTLTILYYQRKNVDKLSNLEYCEFKHLTEFCPNRLSQIMYLFGITHLEISDSYLPFISNQLFLKLPNLKELRFKSTEIHTVENIPKHLTFCSIISTKQSFNDDALRPTRVLDTYGKKLQLNKSHINRHALDSIWKYRKTDTIYTTPPISPTTLSPRAKWKTLIFSPICTTVSSEAFTNTSSNNDTVNLNKLPKPGVI